MKKGSLIDAFGLGLQAGKLIDGEKTRILQDKSTGIRIYDWNSIWIITSVFSILLLLAFVALFKNDIAEKS